MNLTNGTYTWNVQCFDTIGNRAFNEINYTVYVDTVSPVVILNAPINGYNSSGLVEFNWRAYDNMDLGLNCNLTINGSVNASVHSNNNTPINYSITGFNDGKYMWNVTCIDNASNVGYSETRNFTIDSDPPNVSLETPVNNTLWKISNNSSF